MTRHALALFAAAICVACFFLVTNGTARTPRESARRREMRPVPTRVLMIGDSLSAGPFGEVVQQYLARKYGPQNVAAYASCGSSPEHWLAAEPGFYTKCGYREAAPGRRPIFTEGGTGRRLLTPKLETLVQRHQPTIVVVAAGDELDGSRFERRADRAPSPIASSGPRAAPSVRQIIWIAPPDSSALRKRQGRIHRLIQQAATRDRFEVIDSRQLTRYIPGKTGGDGIHYNSEASRAWACASTAGWKRSCAANWRAIARTRSALLCCSCRCLQRQAPRVPCTSAAAPSAAGVDAPGYNASRVP